MALVLFAVGMGRLSGRMAWGSGVGCVGGGCMGGVGCVAGVGTMRILRCRGGGVWGWGLGPVRGLGLGTGFGFVVRLGGSIMFVRRTVWSREVITVMLGSGCVAAVVRNCSISKTRGTNA